MGAGRHRTHLTWSAVTFKFPLCRRIQNGVHAFASRYRWSLRLACLVRVQCDPLEVTLSAGPNAIPVPAEAAHRTVLHALSKLRPDTRGSCRPAVGWTACM